MEIYVMFPVQPKEPKLVQQQKIFICLYNSQKKDQVTKVTFGDTRIADEIMKSRSALEHKRLGRMVRKFDKTVWSTKSIDVVSKGNMLKFMQNRHLKETLLSTHPKILAEASHCDKKWGIGLPIHDSRIHDKECWVGENLLGRILTSVRQNMMNVSTKRKMNCPDGSAEVALPKQLDPNAHRFRACLRENDTFVTVTDYDGGVNIHIRQYDTNVHANSSSTSGDKRLISSYVLTHYYSKWRPTLTSLTSQVHSTRKSPGVRYIE